MIAMVCNSQETCLLIRALTALANFGRARARIGAQLNSRRLQPMKKLFALLFAAALAISLAAPVFAQDQAGGSSDQAASSSTKKSKKQKKEKKPKSDTGAAAPQQ